jgi:uncharacterized protein YraI
MKQIKMIFVIILIIFMAACTTADQNNDGLEISEAVQQTQAAIGTSTPIPDPTNTPIPSAIPPTNTPVPTPTIVAPFTAEVSVTLLGLRSGPSKFFPLIAYYPEGTTVVVSAQIPSSEWVYVTVADSTDEAWEADSNEIGWMSAVFLDIDEKYTGLPFVYYTDDQILTVNVFDTEGYPVNDVNVAVIYEEAGVEYRQDSYTDSAGVSLTYFPLGYHGKVVSVEIVATGCSSSIMNEDCQMIDHFYHSNFENAELPYEGFVDFTFEVASNHLVGYVIDQYGTRVSGVQVRGSRTDDDAYSIAYSDDEGNFILPIGPGNWDIFTQSFNPTIEGDRYSLVDYNGETIILTAP